ncbi:MAG: nucleoside hydrolase [Alistipes sp.]|nr:nucleoside hydrolase [Alistipes sp.]
MKRFFLTLLCCVLCAATFAATPKGNKKPQAIIFETDMGNDIDDAMALDLLFKNMDAGNIKLLGVGVHKNNPYSKEFIDIMRCWYGYKKMPIGVNSACVTDMDCVDYCTKTCKMTDENGAPLFARSKNPKYEEAVDMYRRLLSKADDGSVVIVTVGFSTTIAQLLESQPDKYSKLTGRELVAKKVKYFSAMAGEFTIPEFAEYNVFNDLEAARTLFETSPVPIVFTPWQIGEQVQYPGASIEKDFEWGKPHPMVEAYKHYQQMPYDRPTWDVIAAYYACHPDAGCFTISEPGNIKVVGKGVTQFTPAKDGNCRYMTVTPEQVKQILDYFYQVIPQKPKCKK